MEINENQKNSCPCHKIPIFIHEVAQSLLIINAYAEGGLQRIKENGMDNEQLADILMKINKHTQIIGNKLPDLSF